MLRIERVFLQGFKSFCDPTEVVFDEEGITAVVGPNGCGKSNLSEAVSWVIGEQRPRALRGGKMEDVIFQGSRNRSASGMAEVILTMVVRETFAVRSDNVPAEPAEDVELDPPVASDEPRKRRRRAAEALSKVFQEGERITVGRRLYRTGESEYEMNGRTCRLRDIQDLFAGTGLGGAHYAIIEQGRIGQVLSAKPLDRRALIEEAAGVSKFKMRQHAAELKLEASKQNLSRLTDIITEIERQQNSLKRQAARARRYHRLREEMRDLMRAVYVADYRTTRSSLEGLATVWAAVSQRESQAQARINELEKEQSATHQRARSAEDQLNGTRESAAQVNLENERARQQQSFLTEQISTFGARASQFAREQQTIIERSGLIEQETARLRTDLRKLEDEISAARSVLTINEDSHRQSLARDAEAEELLEAARTRLYDTTTRLERWRQLQQQFEDAVDRCQQRLQGLTVERERTNGQAFENDAQSSELGGRLSQLEERQNETKALLLETQANLDSMRDDRAQSIQKLAEKQRELTATEHRLRSLLEFDERHAYFSESVQLVLNREATRGEAQNGTVFTTLGTLADYVHVDSEYESMVEAALREELQYILVPSFDDAISAIDFLKAEGGGRATFMVVGLHGAELPRPVISSDYPDGEPLSGASGEQSYPSQDQNGDAEPRSGVNGTGRDRLLDLLGLKPEFAISFARAMPGLSAAPVLATIAEAIEKSLAANGSSGSSVFLTRTGERIVGGHLLTSGSGVEKGTGVLALRREIVELRERFGGFGASLENLEAELRAVDTRLADCELDRLDLDGSLRHCEKEMAVLREQWQQAERERDRILTHLRIVGQETERVEQERSEHRTKLSHASAETSQTEQTHASLEIEVSSTHNQVVQLRRLAEDRAQEIARLSADFAARTERRRGLQNDLNRLENESHDLESRLTRSRLETLEAETRLKDLDATQADTSGSIVRLTAQTEVLMAQLDQQTVALNAIRERLEAIDSELRATRDDSTQAREERASIELERVRLTSALEHISDSCYHELSERITDVLSRLEQAAEPDRVVQPSQVVPSDDEEVDESFEGKLDISFWEVPENFNLVAAKARLDELRSKIDSLGPINMMALEELTEIEERFQFISGQKADIEKAVIDTQAAITDIKRRSRERFREAFEQINANFSVMFQELFGGGRGEMRLIDETDILESGIEIIAQPPGKRLQNVLLLSGGEKAMAAIALVLAIFKYRPSPFCILDEVDAPLDEMNIGRFSEKVTEMSRQTQFVLITHSKRTMEAAQTLYGVTMEDPGVSKMVSVRLT